MMSSRSSVPRTLGFGALHLLAVVAGQLTELPGLDEPVLWPAAGVAAVWLVVQRDSRTRGVDIALVALLTMAGMAITGTSPELAAVHGVAAVVAALVLAVAAGRWLPGLWAGEGGGRPLSHLTELWRVILAAGLAAVTGSFLATLGERLLGVEVSTTVAVMRVARDIAGVLIFGVATRQAGYLIRGLRRAPTGPQALEYAAIFAVSTGAYWYTFLFNHSLPIGFLLLVLTVWAAVRMSTPW